MRIGDVVLAGDEFNPDAPVKFALVTGTSHRTVYEQTTVTYVDAAGNVEVIRTTGNHEFFVEGVGWKAAQHLTAGQQLILPDGETATVTSVETEAIPDGIVVYNFSVSDGATYFVDDGQGDVSAVWVHNSASRLLGTALSKAAGAAAKWKRGFAAHHIVAFSSKFANGSRKILRIYGINQKQLNHSFNGVWLPKNTKYSHLKGAIHSKVHTEAYYKKVQLTLEKVVKNGVKEGLSKAEIRVNLQVAIEGIGKKLASNTFKF